MIKIKPSGKEFAKVLHYYNLLEGDSKFKIVCPFHGDVNASMLIDLQSGSYYCFGCNISGDAYDFVKLMNPKLSQLKAWVKFFKILKSNKVINVDIKVLPKQNNRKLIRESKKNFDSLSQTNWHNVYSDHYLFRRGFIPDILNDNNVKINTNYNYPVICPMYDNGKFKGTVARTSKKSIEAERKYLYNTGFDRKTTLVGNYNRDWVIICEGYFDWLKIRQYLHGTKYYDNIICILGWKITQYQIEKLKNQGINKVVSALDKTETGRRGTRLLRQHFEVVRFQFYSPTAKDPGDLDRYDFNISWMNTLEKIKQHNRRKK